MIINFPSSCHAFEALVDISRGSQTRPLPVHYVGLNLIIIAPIDIKLRDVMTVDLRNGHVEVVMRGGIAIWRSGWVN